MKRDSDIPAGDEDRLREQLQTIGTAIEDHRGAEQLDAARPGTAGRRSPTSGRRLVLAALVVGIVATVAGVVAFRNTSTTTVTGPTGPSALDGLHIDRAGTSQVVSTPRGIVVVEGDHGGQPAVYAPDSQGRYSWRVNRRVNSLVPVSAWSDGDAIRVLGHRCPDYRSGTLANTNGELDPGCPSDTLVAIEYRLTSNGWSDKTITTEGIVTDVVAGVGRRAIAMRSAGRPATGLVLIDLESGDVTDLPDSNGNPGASTTVCPSGGTFVVAQMAGNGSTLSSGSGEPGDRTATVSLAKGSDLVTVPIRGDGLPEADVNHPTGCAAGGMVVQSSSDNATSTSATVLVTEPSGEAVLATRLPTADLPISDAPDRTTRSFEPNVSVTTLADLGDVDAENPVHYTADATGTTVIAERVDPGSPGPRGMTVAVFGADRRWHRLSDRLAQSEPIGDASFVRNPIFVGTAGNVYVIVGPVDERTIHRVH